MNARGIPTAAYQVLPRWGTPPPLGYSPCPGSTGGYLRWGTPTPRQGTAWPGQTGGVPKVGYPHQGTPHQVQPGGYPRWGTPSWNWLGYPPHLDLAGVPPPPPGVDRQMDRHESKHNLPVVLCTRSVMNVISVIGQCAIKAAQCAINVCVCFFL